MTTVIRTWTILDENVSVIEKLVTRLNRKAAKHGIGPGMELTFGPRRELVVKKEAFTVRDATVQGDTPRMNGWQFCATIQHAGEAGNILRAIPTLDDTLTIPESYRTASPECDHCKMNRRRNDTFLVHSESKGWAQIGRNCLADFLGSDAVDWQMVKAEMWSLLSDGMSGAGETYGARDRRVHIGDLLAYAAQSVLTDGWVSKGKAESMFKTATADAALTMMGKAKTNVNAVPSMAAIKLAYDALEWAPSWIERELKRPQSSDYVWNMSVVLASEYAAPRSIGLVVSVLGAYQREMAQNVERTAKAAASPSQHIGAVGEKGHVFKDLTCQAIRYMDGQFVSILHTFTDPDGNVVKWFASNEIADKGETVTIKATIKGHGEWNGVKETTITRGRVQN